MKKQAFCGGTALCLLGVIVTSGGCFHPGAADEGVAFENPPGVIINGNRRVNEFGKRFFRPRMAGRRMPDGSLQLMWLIEGWPDKMVGVLVKRQVDGEWTPLAGENAVILPGTYLERDWKAQGFNAEQSAFYSDELKRCLDEKKIRLISPQEQLELARKYGFGPHDGLMFMRNNLYAFLNGFGAIDNQPVEGALYGLFGVGESGNVDRKPFVTWRNLPLEKQVVPLRNFTFTVNAGTRFLCWEIPEELVNAYAIARFEVYRKENNEWKHFAPAHRNPFEAGARYQLWNPLDSDHPDPEFKFVPKNIFYDPLPSTEMKFPSSRYGNLSELELTSSRNETDGAITLSWRIDTKDSGKIAHFKLERSEDWREFIVLAETLDPAETSFTDRTVQKNGVKYTYKLTAGLNNGARKVEELEISLPDAQQGGL